MIFNKTPLHFAVMCNYTDDTCAIVELLLQNGADKNVKDNQLF